MNKFGCFHKAKKRDFRGQAIVEFAIVLPILLMVMVGILEFGRMVFIYSAVTNASRNAVRYASAVGLEDTGNYHKYLYCDGIRQTAINSAFLLRPSQVTITITYDDGPATKNNVGSCNVTGGEANVPITSGRDRVNVTVSAQYRPMVRLVPIPNRTFTASSYRTILGIVDVDN